MLGEAEKVMAPHPSTPAWKIPWTEEPGRLQSMVSLSETRLSDFTFTFHFRALEKAMATHSSVLDWRIPGTGEPGGLLSMGLHRVGHGWKDLAAAAWLTTTLVILESWFLKSEIISYLSSSKSFFDLVAYFRFWYIITGWELDYFYSSIDTFAVNL